MEGLIPFVYRAIVQYKNAKEGPLAPWFNESPSASYMRLPGDSGRFQISENRQVFLSEYGFSMSSPSSSTSAAPPPPPTATTTTQIIVSTGVQSPAVCRFSSRRVVA